MFDNQIRDRLAHDLRSAVFRKVQWDNSNLNDSISVKYAEHEAVNDLHKQLRNEQAERRKSPTLNASLPNEHAARQRSVAASLKQGAGATTAAVNATLATNGNGHNFAREMNRVQTEPPALARAVEEQLSAAMTEKVSRWLTDSACQNATIKVALQRGQSRARLEWSSGCARGVTCVSRRHVVDLNDVKLTGTQRNNLRVVLSEHNVVRLIISCQARLIAEHFLSVSDMLSLIGAKQAKL